MLLKKAWFNFPFHWPNWRLEYVDAKGNYFPFTLVHFNEEQHLRKLNMQQIAKQIKAKGLQKLRWYCEMCKKQCRDDNVSNANGLNTQYPIISFVTLVLSGVQKPLHVRVTSTEHVPFLRALWVDCQGQL